MFCGEAMANLVNKVIYSKWAILIPFAFFLILAIGRVYTNRPGCDEAWFASSAVNLVRNGFMGCTIVAEESVHQNLHLYTFWQPPLYFLTEALTFKLFGIGLFQVRFISVFWGLVGLVALYYLARELFDNDRKLLLLSLTLVGTDLFYLSRASDGRMDMMAASLSLIALALYVTLRKKNLYWAVFLSNLFVCLSGLTHPTGLLGLFVLIFLILYLDRKRVGLRIGVIGLVPYALGAIGWGAYIIQDVEAFKTQFFSNVIRGDTLRWTAVSHELVTRYLRPYALLPQSVSIQARAIAPILIFFITCFITAPFIANKKNRLVWSMLLIIFLGMMFIVGNKTSAYLVWITPFFLLNSVTVWDALKGRKFVNIFFLLAFSYILLFSLIATPRGIVANSYQNQYLHDLNRFDSEYYTGGKIYGSGEIAFFYNFNDEIIQDDSNMGYYTGVKPKYFVVESRYEVRFKLANPEARNYINKNLSNEYTKIFEGNFYTFFERKS